MNLDVTITISPDVIAQEVAGETVLLDLTSEHYFGLDETGTRIWQLIEEHGNLRAVFQQMLAEYDVSDEALEADMLELLEEIAKHGLITVTEDQNP